MKKNSDERGVGGKFIDETQGLTQFKAKRTVRGHGLREYEEGKKGRYPLRRGTKGGFYRRKTRLNQCTMW